MAETYDTNPPAQLILDRTIGVHNHLLGLAEASRDRALNYIGQANTAHNSDERTEVLLLAITDLLIAQNEILATALTETHTRLGDMWIWQKTWRA